MNNILSGTELSRPFLPTKDFDFSKRFYEALGFRKVLDGEVAIFVTGSGGFILQRHFQKDWASNFMMQLMVDDLDVWWSHIESLDLAKSFGVPEPKRQQFNHGAYALHMSWIRLGFCGTSRNDVRMFPMICEAIKRAERYSC